MEDLNHVELKVRGEAVQELQSRIKMNQRMNAATLLVSLIGFGMIALAALV